MRLYLKLFFITFFVSLSFINAQWSAEWTTKSVPSTDAAGWIEIKYDGNIPEYRFYTISWTEILIMEKGYNSVVEYSYSFNAAEQLAGNNIYSTGYDLTGDGIVEFYIVAYYGTAEPYRQSIKIFDITTGTVLLEKNSENSFYTSPVIWDADNDNVLECSYVVYDYPAFNNYRYEILNTGVVTSTKGTIAPVRNFKLMQNYPNPFNPETTIEYQLSEPDYVKIKIYDVKGELINSVDEGYKPSGNHQIIWNGFNKIGAKASSGAYFYQLEASNRSEVKKMLLIK